MDTTRTNIEYSDSGMGDNELVIESVFVLPQDRGRGKGSAMVKEAIEYARANGYATIGLYAESIDSSVSTEELVAWYERLGFQSDADCTEMMTYTI